MHRTSEHFLNPRITSIALFEQDNQDRFLFAVICTDAWLEHCFGHASDTVFLLGLPLTGWQFTGETQ